MFKHENVLNCNNSELKLKPGTIIFILKLKWDFLDIDFIER